MNNPEIETIEKLRSMIEFNIRRHDEEREQLTSTTGQLTIEDLSQAGGSEIAVSDVFQETVGKIGWPQARQESLPWAVGEQLMGDDPDKVFTDLVFNRPEELNNFPAFFQRKPTFDKTEAPFLQEGYVMAPMMHRLMLVDPELFQVLHDTIGSQPSKTVAAQAEYIRSFEDKDGKNPLVHVMRQAYVLMGRLYMRGDTAIVFRLAGYSGEPEPKKTIENALQTA